MADVPPRETSPAAKSEEKRMFSQARVQCLFDQFWSSFRCFMDISNTRTLVMATEQHEGLSVRLYFGGFFSGMAVLFDESCSEL